MTKTRILKSTPYKNTTLSSKVIHALAIGKGITWLDKVRIPYIDEKDIGNPNRGKGYPMLDPKKGWNQNSIINTVTIGERGRFPANLLCSDDILNDGRIYKVGEFKPTYKYIFGGNSFHVTKTVNTSYAPASQGSYSRYFDLDKWWSTLLERIKHENSDL
jgi:hypothetical protein